MVNVKTLGDSNAMQVAGWWFQSSGVIVYFEVVYLLNPTIRSDSDGTVYYRWCTYTDIKARETRLLCFLTDGKSINKCVIPHKPDCSAAYKVIY